MSRLTNDDYIRQYNYLRQLWLTKQQVFSYLPAKQQWELHGFFNPSKEKTDDELVRYRKEATLDRPSLPHKAGRALAQLKAVIAGKAKPYGTSISSTNRTGKTRIVTVRGVVNPEIDMDKFLAAFKRLLVKTDELDRAIQESRERFGSPK